MACTTNLLTHFFNLVFFSDEYLSFLTQEFTVYEPNVKNIDQPDPGLLIIFLINDVLF